MAKGKKRNRISSSGWTASDHNAQVDKKQRKYQRSQQSATATTEVTVAPPPNRTDHLTHNTQEKRDAAKVRLHITKVQRELNDLKQRLTSWDPVRETKIKEEKIQKDMVEKEASNGPQPTKKRRGRLGPESWKLRGAARPAWEVYDFDTRYVDPHLREHEQASATASRSQNLLRKTKGTDGQESSLLHRIAPEEGREYLKLLMQLGYLSQEAKQYKTARAAFLECIELEGDNVTSNRSPITITTARESLMRMYLDLKRFDAAFRLGERFPTDGSCVIRFSMAWLAIHLQKEEQIANSFMLQAIKSNIFATLYLCYYDTFGIAMEFTEELLDADYGPQSSFEEAIEYCSSNYAALWHQTDGATERLKQYCFHDRGLTTADLEWKDRLSCIESEYLARNGKGDNDVDKSESEWQSYGIDIPMFAGMFRTAMDMIHDPCPY